MTDFATSAARFAAETRGHELTVLAGLWGAHQYGTAKAVTS